MDSTAWRKVARFCTLVAAALALGTVFAYWGVPAPFLISAMLSAAAFAWRGFQARIPVAANGLAQALIGVYIADKIAPGMDMKVAIFVPWFVLITCATLGFCGVLGIYLSRSGWIQGPAAVWGLSPGAATAMIVMADEYGANRQMVSLMQYTRVLCVILSSVLVVGIGDGHGPQTLVAQFLAWDGAATLGSAAIVMAGLLLAQCLRWPAARLLYPMVIGIAVMRWQQASYSPPVLLMVAAYLVLGIKIGSGFSRPLVQKFRQVFGRLLLSILALIVFSLASSCLFATATGVDFKTAYLAFSPGGLDTAALIGASADLDMHIVMVSQAVRMFIVILMAPFMVNYIVKRWALTN